jgi:tetratricopeptide (TPR) repeat protein
VSDAPPYTPSPAFDRAAQALDLTIESFWFNQRPAEQAERLEARIKLAARLLSKAADIRHAQALDAVAQALRFPAWLHLSAHLGRAADFGPGPLPKGWLDALSAAVVLTVTPEDDVRLPAAQLDAFEALGQTLAMLTDAPKQRVLDTVSAALCGGRHWHEVRHRNPLNTTAPLYRFVVDEHDAEGGVGGVFEASPACQQLVEELDEAWQGYEGFTKPQKKRARGWVEAALALQPGFLEAGLALAWMQRDTDPAQALATATATLRQAEALIPKGFKGRILWGHLGNRGYHRLLWLQMQLNHEQGHADAAARIARKLLRLNPGDNLGVRYVLPLLLLGQGKVAAARRSLAALADEPGLTAAAMRAFVAYAEGKPAEFRRELATALFTLPMLRAFLLNDPKALPPGEPGYRMVMPDMETFADFAWPSYGMVPGLRRACAAFLAEPAVREAERELRNDWAGYWEARRQPGATPTGSWEGWQQLLDHCIDRVAPALTRRKRRR